MFAIRARRKVASERDFLDAVDKVVRQGTKFSSTYVFQIIVYSCNIHIACLALYIRYITSFILYVCHILLGLCMKTHASLLARTVLGTYYIRFSTLRGNPEKQSH